MSGQGQVVAPNQAPGAPRVQFVEDFFIYEVDFGTIAVGATLNGNFQILADSDFKLIKLTSVSSNSGTQDNVPPRISVQINDSGSGRNLFSSAVPIANVFGTGQLPFIMPIPRIFKARSNVVVTIANLDPAIIYDDLHLSFIGTKIFQLGQ
jgi:hypothetical protein